MLTSLQSCHHLATGSWPLALAAAADVVQPLLAAAAFHTSSTSLQSSSGSSSRSRSSRSSSSSELIKALEQIRAASAPCIPAAEKQGSRALLDDSQQESLALLKRFNISQPFLQGQVILAKVLQSTPKMLLVDPGYYGANYVSRQELASAAGYDEKGDLIPRKTAAIHPGDYVKLRLSAFNTPYGNAQLDPVGIQHDVRQKLVWVELQQRMIKGLPVQGRILNATAGGYAVGVAGYIALLQRQQASVQQTRRIGVLQDFYIYRMDSRRRRIELSNMRKHKESMEEVYRQTMM